MLDPREQQKGGFGAFAARERERQADAAASGSAPTREATGGATSDAASDETGNAAAPSRPRRFFGFLLP